MIIIFVNNKHWSHNKMVLVSDNKHCTIKAKPTEEQAEIPL